MMMFDLEKLESYAAECLRLEVSDSTLNAKIALELGWTQPTDGNGRWWSRHNVLLSMAIPNTHDFDNDYPPNFTGSYDAATSILGDFKLSYQVVMLSRLNQTYRASVKVMEFPTSSYEKTGNSTCDGSSEMGALCGATLLALVNLWKQNILAHMKLTNDPAAESVETLLVLYKDTGHPELTEIISKSVKAGMAIGKGTPDVQ